MMMMMMMKKKKKKKKKMMMMMLLTAFHKQNISLAIHEIVCISFFSGHGTSNALVGAVIGGVVGCLGLVALCIFVAICCQRRSKLISLLSDYLVW
jgi:thiamine transporter ThiT